MTADVTPAPSDTPEPTEPGWYAYSGGAQSLLFHLREIPGIAEGRQWSVHTDNVLAHDCAWGYIEQALGFEWTLDRIPLPVDPGAIEAVEALTEAIRLTVEYIGTDALPAVPGWSWYDALVRFAPEKAEALRAAGEYRVQTAPVDRREPHWLGDRLVEQGRTVCVHNVGLTEGLWCGGCRDRYALLFVDDGTTGPPAEVPDDGDRDPHRP